jgi:hypothetical protein
MASASGGRIQSAKTSSDQLIERASLTNYGRDNLERQFILYSRTGFTAALQKRVTSQPGIVLHTPQSMLRGVGEGIRKRKRPPAQPGDNAEVPDERGRYAFTHTCICPRKRPRRISEASSISWEQMTGHTRSLWPCGGVSSSYERDYGSLSTCGSSAHTAALVCRLQPGTPGLA